MYCPGPQYDPSKNDAYDRSINTGFASLRAALPTCHPTDSKAVVLRKAVARLQQLEQLIGPEASSRHSDKREQDRHAQYSVSPEMSTLPTPDHGRSGGGGNSSGRYNDWEEKPQYDDYPRSHGRPHSQSLSQPQPPRRQHSHTHSHSHSESLAYPRSPSGSINGDAKRGREHHWQEETMGNRRRLS